MLQSVCADHQTQHDPTRTPVWSITSAFVVFFSHTWLYCSAVAIKKKKKTALSGITAWSLQMLKLLNFRITVVFNGLTSSSRTKDCISMKDYCHSVQPRSIWLCKYELLTEVKRAFVSAGILSLLSYNPADLVLLCKWTAVSRHSFWWTVVHPSCFLLLHPSKQLIFLLNHMFRRCFLRKHEYAALLCCGQQVHL